MIQLIDFLLTKTKVGEFCVIRDCGWPVAYACIDHEDLFQIPVDMYDNNVKADSWGTFRIKDANGNPIDVPCHYIDIDHAEKAVTPYVCDICGKTISAQELSQFYDINICDACDKTLNATP